MTRETYLERARKIVARPFAHVIREKLLRPKLVYGSGVGTGALGLCIQRAWAKRKKPVAFVEITAIGETDPKRLLETLIHELGHVLTPGDGHGNKWRDATAKLGLVEPQANRSDGIAPAVWARLKKLPYPKDGSPNFPDVRTPRPCGAGVGTQGGTSRGKGSGSRMRLHECGCVPPVKARVARDTFNARCLECKGMFKCTTRTLAD